MLFRSKERGYKKGRFSFNVKGGRCEACSGDGELIGAVRGIEIVIGESQQ